MCRPKKYLTEEERKAAKREAVKRYQERHPEKVRKYQEENKEHLKEYNKQYYQDNKEYFKEYYKQYFQDNKEYFKEYQKQYFNTTMGRAFYLIKAYKQADKERNRGECTIKAKWMVENIFSKPCHYCGESDWTKIGCDRIDNSKPHTPDNVVPCCDKCNRKKGTMSYDEFMKRISNK